jgi:endonuclease YncB( thermonuclease family)
MIHYDLTQLPKPSQVYVGRCFDGDTLRVVGDHYVGLIRIWGIDAPERGQAWFLQAYEALILLTRGVQITIHPVTWDRYNRLIAKLLGRNFEDVGLHMIQGGNAWYENLHAPDVPDYLEAHRSARSDRRGLWSLPSPHVPPWKFRRYHRTP